MRWQVGSRIGILLHLLINNANLQLINRAPLNWTATCIVPSCLLGKDVGPLQCNYECLPHWEKGSILGDTSVRYILLYPWVLVLCGRASLSSWIESLLHDYRPYCSLPCPFVTQQLLLRITAVISATHDAKETEWISNLWTLPSKHCHLVDF